MNINATLLGQTISFLLFVWFCKKFVWPMMMGPIMERQAKIADGLAAAEKGLKDQEMAADNVEQAIKQAKTEAAEIVAHAKARDTQMIEEAKVKATEEAGRVMAGAQAEIDQEINRAKDSLRNQVSVLAVAGASKILGKEVDAGAHKAALEKLIAQI